MAFLFALFGVFWVLPGPAGETLMSWKNLDGSAHLSVLDNLEGKRQGCV